MKTTLLSLAIAATILSCNKKKSEDPKPVEQPKPTPVVVKPKPIWPRMGYTEKNDYGPVIMCGLHVYEKYLRSDTLSSPKVDIYLVTAKRVEQGKVVEVYYSREVKVWWANGKPQSDYMVFRPSKDWNFEQSTKEQSVDASCYMPYSMPQ